MIYTTYLIIFVWFIYRDKVPRYCVIFENWQPCFNNEKSRRRTYTSKDGKDDMRSTLRDNLTAGKMQ